MAITNEPDYPKGLPDGATFAAAVKSCTNPKQRTRVHDKTARLSMIWYHDIAYFFGGALRATAVPHDVSGVMGRAFQSPLPIVG